MFLEAGHSLCAVGDRDGPDETVHCWSASLVAPKLVSQKCSVVVGVIVASDPEKVVRAGAEQLWNVESHFRVRFCG